MVGRLWQSAVRWWCGETKVDVKPAKAAPISVEYACRHVPFRGETKPDDPKPSRRNPAKVRAAMRKLEREVFTPEPGLDRDNQ